MTETVQFCECTTKYINDLVDRELSLESFTCYKCLARKTCEFSWDLYNINGDCLMFK